MLLTPGTPFGHYEILGVLGAGGMGEVYRARDTRLGRQVAIKTLPAAFTADPDRLTRFRREARLLATLNHPHIGAIYELEEGDGASGLVLELVEGQTLAERIASGPLPVDDALSMAGQIAGALDAAHQQGIVHRDLKPANIKITPTGTVKVLDFGLAKAVGAAAGADGSTSPTVTESGTRAGAILGTAAYMSPEQARGHVVDKRSDIWSFGCVVFELLTGGRAFQGRTASDTVAAILTSEPDWGKLPAATPSSIRRLLRRCLEKDATRRLRDIGDAAIDIAEAGAMPGDETSPAVPLPARPRWRAIVASGVLASAVLAAVGFVAGSSWRTPNPRAPTVLRLSIAEGTGNIDFGGLSLSRDGTRLAYAGKSAGLVSVLYVRALDELEARPLDGTEGAMQPFFSPDGEWIAFFTNSLPQGGFARPSQLQKVAFSGGRPITIAEASALGGSWGDDNTIVFTGVGDAGLGLYRVSADGGAPERLTTPAVDRGERRHAWPEHLPGGKALLFSVSGQASFDEGSIAVLSLGDRTYHTIVEQGFRPRVLSSGQLAYMVGKDLMTLAFDASRQQVTGPPSRAVQGILTDPVSGEASFDVSDNGLLVYTRTSDRLRRLVWVTRDGRVTPLAAVPAEYYYPRLSPDGKRLAVGIGTDVWLIDLERTAPSRVTSGDRGLSPPPPITAWTPDGRHLTFNRRVVNPRTSIEWFEPSQGGPSTPLLMLPQLTVVGSWSFDGRALALFRFEPSTKRDLWVFEPGVGAEPRPFLVTPANERAPQFSPDGRWIAYVSDHSGRDEVYVSAYPGPGAQVVVSTNGGAAPMWSHNGRELFYRAGSLMMAVPVGPGAAPSIGKPSLLFDQTFEFDQESTLGVPNYDVAADGQRFIMVSSNSHPAPGFVVVANWFEELARQAPARR